MHSRYLIAIAFLTGLGGGWLAKTLLDSSSLKFDAAGANDSRGTTGTAVPEDAIGLNSRPLAQTESAQTSGEGLVNRTDPDTSTREAQQESSEDTTRSSITGTFDKLLRDRRYYDAMSLFQQQKQNNSQNAIQLRTKLLNELRSLTENRNNSDFSELVESYLSIYYDDIDVLLLLAEFNQANGSYLEVVNVFLLAKTYAYSDPDQKNVLNRFDEFVIDIDNSYTGQQDWWSLINLYAHISDSGLMTSSYRYRQSLAHLRSGDEAFAIEQFKELLDDPLVGESAAKVLGKLTPEAEDPIIVDHAPWEGAETIALEKLGNQYAVNLTNNRQDSVKLLIDTGASMTAMSRNAYNILNASGEAVEQDKRVFRTAGGLVQGTVYSVPELSLGPYRLENTQIAVIDFDRGRSIDGLLGMNILGQFRFHIDQDTPQLLLMSK